jgi:hypothetical protein
MSVQTQVLRDEGRMPDKQAEGYLAWLESNLPKDEG